MEQTNISMQYGITRTPSLGADGELSECVNLIPQSGELVNIQECKKVSAPEHYPIDSYSWVEKYSHDVVTADWTEHVVSEESNYFTYTMSSISLAEGGKYKLVVDIERIEEQELSFEHSIKITFNGKEYVNYLTSIDGTIDIKNNRMELLFTQGSNTTTSVEIRDSSDVVLHDYDLPTISFKLYKYELATGATKINYVEVPVGYKLAYVHEYAEIKNHIFQKDNALYWVADDMLTLIHDFSDDDGITSISNVKLVLVVSTNNGTRYIRYVNDEGYRYLGKLPDLSGSYPYLNSDIRILYDDSGESVENSKSSADFAKIITNLKSGGNGKDYIFFENDTSTKEFGDLMFSCIDFLRKRIHNDGCFCFPFYVKLAIRLFDGSCVSVTRPFLMRPTDKGQPLIIGSCDASNNTITLMPVSVESSLLIFIDGIGSEWEDVITGVEVYVTPEILNYTDGSYESLVRGIKYDSSILSGYRYERTRGDITQFDLSSISDAKYLRLKQTRQFTGERYGVNKTKQHHFFGSYRFIAVASGTIKGFGDNDFKKITITDTKWAPYFEHFTDASSYDWYTKTDWWDDEKSNIHLYNHDDVVTLYCYSVESYAGISKDFYIELKRADGLSYDEALESNEFFLLDSISFADIQALGDKEFTPKFKGRILDSISARYRLNELQIGADDVSSSSMIPYNSRLSVVASKKKYKSAGDFEALKDRPVTNFQEIEVDGIEVTTEDYREEHPYEAPASKIRGFYVHIKNGGLYSSNSNYAQFYPNRLSSISYSGSSADKVYIDQAFDLPTYSAFLPQIVYVDIYKNEQVLISGSSYGLKIYRKDKFFAGNIIEYPFIDSRTGGFSYCYNGGASLQYTNSWAYIKWELGNTFQSIREYISHYATAMGLDVTDADIDYSVNVVIGTCKSRTQTAIRGYMYDHTITINGTGGYIYNEVPFDFDDADKFQDEHGLVYQSQVNNPFLFVNKYTAEIGCDEVYRLSTSAKALSQGQFGQFPLYAFCDNGIWAISINDEGAFVAKQPVSRDVLTNIDSVTQIDDAVVFVTNQGLKLIQGSDVVLLSKEIEGLNLSETFFKDSVDTFAQKRLVSSPYVADTTQFIAQIQTARIVYDYSQNLLHIFTTPASTSTTPDKHYVYSFDTKAWATQVLPQQLTTAVAGYPLSTMQFGNALYQYDKSVSSTKRIGYALTRAVSLGNPLARKALYDLRLVGQRTSANTVRRVAVFVSNDNVNWKKLTSLKALSAKYYRFLIMTYMSDIDTISGLALQHEVRYDHKMRGH